MDFLSAIRDAQGTYLNVFIAIMRWASPVLVLLLLARCIRPLLTFRREPEIWAWLLLKDGKELPITHWENVIGSSKRSDIVIESSEVSKNHAVLTRYDDGSWTISDADSKGGLFVNGKRVSICALEKDDIISIGGVEMALQPISARQEQKLAQLRTKASSVLTSFANVLLLTLFQILCALAFVLDNDTQYAQSILIGFSGLVLCQWLLLLFYVCIQRTSFEVETIAFFLCTMGMAAICSVNPGEAIKQLVALVLGLTVFLVIGWALRDLERMKKIRHLALLGGIGFLLITLVFGQEYYGAKNWLVIGPLSVQPSEFAKVCFVCAGAATMDKIMTKRNLILFIGYSAILCGCLALMNDFGTALIFFCGFLIIAYMRSGSVGTVALAIAALVFAGVVALKIAPHALRRFATWRHIWEAPLDGGYQQTRALMCMASGGLLGLGAGQGWLKNMFAADSDLVMATLGEEWGLVMFILLIASVVTLALFAVRTSAMGRGSFYIISSCTAAGILLIQAILNALGTVDVVPLTGVTFPFVSNGGSSMIASWGMLAFIKAADTRQNASFAVRLKGGKVHE